MDFMYTPDGYAVDHTTMVLLRGEILLATNGKEYVDDETILKLFDIFMAAKQGALA